MSEAAQWGPIVFQTAWAIFLPVGVLWLAKRAALVRKLSPVLVCYAASLALGNQPFVPIDQALALNICAASIALAIPLMLFSVNFVAWWRLAGTTVLSFFFCCFAALAAATAAHFLVGRSMPESAKMAGMLTAVYIGCTGNMNAVGLMVHAKPETFVMLNTSDMVMSIIYLPFLLTLAGPLLGKILPPFPYADGKPPVDEDWNLEEEKPPRFRPSLPGVGLTIVIVAISAALTQLLPAAQRDGAILLVITTLAVAASFSARVRALPGSQYMGQYLLLIFFSAIGATSNLAKLVTASPLIFLYDFIAMFGAIFIHLTLCVIFRIDRDTAIITSTATIFSPPFVPPVAMALKNKEALVSGIASGLVGYAVANYAGIALTWLLS
jgi:uncharacterized membrane protein